MDDKIKLTPEQLAGLQGFLQKNDITANMTVKREYNFKGENAKVFKRAKEFFGEYWLGNLRKRGVKRKMKNFSKDHPVNFLENADADYFSEQVSEIYTDPDKLNEYVDRFLRCMNSRLCSDLTAMRNRSVKRLTICLMKKYIR